MERSCFTVWSIFKTVMGSLCLFNTDIFIYECNIRIPDSFSLPILHALLIFYASVTLCSANINAPCIDPMHYIHCSSICFQELFTCRPVCTLHGFILVMLQWMLYSASILLLCEFGKMNLFRNFSSLI